MRDGEDDEPGLLRVDVRVKAVGARLKAVAGVFPQARCALLPVGDGMHVKYLQPAFKARKLRVTQRRGGQQHRADRLAVHALVMRARYDRLQKAHRDGVGIRVHGKTVLLAVVDKALRHLVLLIELMVLCDGQQRAQGGLAVRRGDGGRFAVAEARHFHKAAHGRRAQRGEAGQRGTAANEAVIAQPLAVVDALVFARLLKIERGERRLRDLIERVHAAAGRLAAGENLPVAHCDVERVLRAGDQADDGQRRGKARLFEDEQQHARGAQQRQANRQRAQRVAGVRAGAAVADDLRDALRQGGQRVLGQEEGDGQQQHERAARGKGGKPRTAAVRVAQR